jgi:hypothetical protein
MFLTFLGDGPLEGVISSFECLARSLVECTHLVHLTHPLSKIMNCALRFRQTAIHYFPHVPSILPYRRRTLLVIIHLDLERLRLGDRDLLRPEA